jgi:hypothetical protein
VSMRLLVLLMGLPGHASGPCPVAKTARNVTVAGLESLNCRNSGSK